MSNTPFVKTSFLPASRNVCRSMSSSSRVRIFFRIAVKLKLYERERAKGKALSAKSKVQSGKSKALGAKRYEVESRPYLFALTLTSLLVTHLPFTIHGLR